MSKRLLNRVLFIALAIIWGFIGYKFFKKNPISYSIDKKASISSNTSKINIKNEFNLDKLIISDPFLKRKYNHFKTEKKHLINLQSTKKNTVKPFPKIQYFGFIQGEKSKSPLVLIKINNQLKRVREGEKIENLIIYKVYKDSIEILNGKEKKVFLIVK